jgi:prepilin-type N-terminal cleavage/methylation domain-containing protein
MLRLVNIAPQRGFSLIELMVSVTLGLLLLAAVSQIYVNTTGSSHNTLKMARVNQELRAAMDVMVRDIQRAGYYNQATVTGTGVVAGATNPFTQSASNLQVNGSCITYTYDRDNNTTVDNTEKMAFYLNDDAVRMRNGGTSDSNSCPPNSAEGITDSNRVTITALSFDLTTHCINTSVALTGPNVDNCTTITPTAGDVLIKPRQVTITITGKPKEDSSGEMQRTITDTVHLRNHLVCIAPC